MRHDTKSVLVGLLTAVMLVMLVSFTGAAMGHANGPSQSDTAAIETIRKNQDILAKNRAAYRAFLQAKKDNEEKSTILAKNGYSIDWKHLQVQKAPLDLDKLAKAVACAETSCGTDGTAIHRNNFHGIMCWPHGQRTPCYFHSPADSFAAFKRIWSQSYKRFPDMALATRWTGNDNPVNWLKTVDQVYHSL